jgi:hypothetical protein
MEGQCNSIECSTETSDCRCSTENSCPCGDQGCPECNPSINLIDFATLMWHKAAFTALSELKKDKVKKKLDAAFGDMLDKSADAAVEAMSKKLQSMVIKSSSENEFRNKLSSILSESAKRK